MSARALTRNRPTQFGVGEDEERVSALGVVWRRFRTRHQPVRGAEPPLFDERRSVLEPGGRRRRRFPAFVSLLWVVVMLLTVMIVLGFLLGR